MLRSLKSLKGYRILAVDGEVGNVNDFLFDDQEWILRYIVVDTGKWLPGKKTLLPPSALRQPDWKLKVFPVSLNREQVENSPDIATSNPVSRQQEIELFKHYGWDPYWTSTRVAPDVGEVPASAMKDEPPKAKTGDPNLRSVGEVVGYSVDASDGELGSISDFIVDDEPWVVRYMVIDTGGWLPGRKVLVSPDWVKDVVWSESAVSVDLSQSQIEGCPEYDPSRPVNRRYEVRLYDYYGRPGYWQPPE